MFEGVLLFWLPYFMASVGDAHFPVPYKALFRALNFTPNLFLVYYNRAAIGGALTWGLIRSVQVLRVSSEHGPYENLQGRTLNLRPMSGWTVRTKKGIPIAVLEFVQYVRTVWTSPKPNISLGPTRTIFSLFSLSHLSLHPYQSYACVRNI